MSLPGFSAAASLGSTRAHYASRARPQPAAANVAGAVVQQQIGLPPGWTFGPGGFPIPGPPPPVPFGGPGPIGGTPFNPIGWPSPPTTWPPPPPPPTPPPPAGAAGGAAAGVAVAAWIAAIVAWAAAIYELTLDVETDDSSGIPCAGTGVDRITRVVDDVSWGCRRSHNNAAAEARGFCATLAGVCTGTCPSGGTCTPKLNIIDTSQFSYGLACRTVMQYNCQCRC